MSIKVMKRQIISLILATVPLPEFDYYLWLWKGPRQVAKVPDFGQVLACTVIFVATIPGCHR